MRSFNMQKSQKGFTLIELVVVIVLLGILGVTALARFQNLALSARDATIQGIASEVTGGSSINYAAAITNLAGFTDTSDETTCAAIVPALLTGGLPALYTVATGGGACVLAGDTFTCDIGHPDVGTTTAAATIICSGP
jgi:MSHA pilin protein MshA